MSPMFCQKLFNWGKKKKDGQKLDMVFPKDNSATEACPYWTHVRCPSARSSRSLPRAPPSEPPPPLPPLNRVASPVHQQPGLSSHHIPPIHRRQAYARAHQRKYNQDPYNTIGSNNYNSPYHSPVYSPVAPDSPRTFSPVPYSPIPNSPLTHSSVPSSPVYPYPGGRFSPVPQNHISPVHHINNSPSHHIHVNPMHQSSMHNNMVYHNQMQQKVYHQRPPHNSHVHTSPPPSTGLPQGYVLGETYCTPQGLMTYNAPPPPSRPPPPIPTQEG
ncbi:unnamed protein product, partial [Meganyctiphanes norvegica]